MNNLNPIENEEVMVQESDITSALNAIDTSVNSVETKLAQRLKKKTKKTISQLADEIVNAYLSDRSDNNWRTLQEFFWYGIKQFAYKYVQNWDDAYDMTIETFISALTNIHLYNPEKAKFSTWLWTICKNNCIYFLKNKQRIPVVDNDISDLYDSAMLSNATIQSTQEFTIVKNQVNELSLDEISDSIYQISIDEIHRMGGLGQDILEMKLLKNMKIREISDKLDMNESTVKNYLYKYKTNLQKIIQKKHKALYDMYIDMKREQDENKLF